jgi:hypothetical protein
MTEIDSNTVRLGREFVTMTKMVELYCGGQHGLAPSLCAECQEFLDYAQRRLEKCPYGEDKPTCANCPIHCYKARQRVQARTIMRYAGPRMLLRHPALAIRHKLDGLRKADHPINLSREARRLGRRQKD